MDQNNIIISPLMTEKTIKEAGRGKFTFKVNLAAKKPEIRRAIEEKFNVKIVAIETAILKGRKKRVGKRRAWVKLGPFKKAIVELLPGQKIEIFTGLENEPKT